MDLKLGTVYPAVLWLIPVVSIAIIIALRRGKSRRPLSVAILRACTISFLLCVISSPFIEKRKEVTDIIALVDVSESIDEKIGNRGLSELKSLLDNEGQYRIIPFARRVGEPASLIRNFSALQVHERSLDTTATNLENALSSPSVHPGASILLLSDGFPTEGTSQGVVQVALERHLRIFPIVPAGALSNGENVRLAQLAAPLVAPSGKSVDIRATLANTTATRQRRRIKIDQEGKVLFDQVVTLEAGKEQVFTAQSDPSKEGIQKISASFSPETTQYEPSSETIFLSSSQKEKVLLLSGSPEDERLLKQALREESYQLSNVVAGESIPDVTSVRTVILNNIAYQSLGREKADQIARLVEQGGGLVMIGGGKSFGLGGYIGSSIDPLLPVNLVPPRKELKRVNVAVELVIDKSQSMSKESRLLYAREAAKEVVRMLKDEDLIGVIGFDSNPFVVQRLSPLRDVRDSVQQRIDVLFPARETRLMPALQEARRSLERIEAGRKHVIVLTDGKLPDASPFYVELCRQMRSTGISVTTVLLSGEVEEDLLQEMADAGGGRFYQTSDPQSLPRLFVQDVKVASGEKSIREASEYGVRRGPGELRTTEIHSYPPLLGYVETRPKDGANLELIVVGGERSDPLLASGRSGKGKVIAFTSDANGRWSSQWAGWGRFRTFWANVVDAVRPSLKASSVPFDLRTYAKEGRLVLDATVYQDSEKDVFTAHIQDETGEEQEVTLEKVAPGRYQAIIPSPKPGRYDFRGQVGESVLTPVAFHVSVAALAEQKGLSFNMSLLSELASRTGGKINPAEEDLRLQAQTMSSRVDLKPLLFSLAFAMFLLEIVGRIGIWKIPGRARLTRSAFL